MSFFALVSKNCIPYSLARVFPSSKETTRCSSMSHLLPIKILLTCTSACLKVRTCRKMKKIGEVREYFYYEDNTEHSNRRRRWVYLLNLPHPIANRVKGSTISNIIYQKNALCHTRQNCLTHERS